MTVEYSTAGIRQFLSIQAQDFIEDECVRQRGGSGSKFLSIQAQDFIEENEKKSIDNPCQEFLSIQAQDFIEDASAQWRTTSGNNS